MHRNRTGALRTTPYVEGLLVNLDARHDPIDGAARARRVRQKTELQREKEPEELTKDDVRDRSVLVGQTLLASQRKHARAQSRQAWIHGSSYDGRLAAQLLLGDLLQQIDLVVRAQRVRLKKAHHERAGFDRRQAS